MYRNGTVTEENLDHAANLVEQAGGKEWTRAAAG